MTNQCVNLVTLVCDFAITEFSSNICRFGCSLHRHVLRRVPGATFRIGHAGCSVRIPANTAAASTKACELTALKDSRSAHDGLGLAAEVSSLNHEYFHC